MKKLVLAITSLALLFVASPLAARPRHSGACRIVHPAYYYQSLGRRSHLNYRRSHFLRFHAARYSPRPAPYRSQYWAGRYQSGRYQSDRYRDYRYFPQNRRHRLRRHRIGVYLEF